ncbi:TetR/AcrR family transcriptional regulator [Halalkalibacterium halodurans]|uniref:TetR/AcrR family transcriptional regulator n=1 Tax=Halalkalibacterium halodurans TaxID=86665 RepID=UPI002AA985DC|nr:TetR/AcrR family transcriptional regulator [Halalkalibacterium halodurans]MDY7220849.1 TetR/AcrR family transcriptional regulator [Halalkalibacterium halodurans]MDY7240088.1 TetR/AcrR family transcriptional regulator [Halalkalibacterium halodurans]MED4082641.1 TetR/AcrR family transcriptional regulator [Halalkalibacterium halodurans]MED4084479.1 TetR/AcrR family transcriptional regulator [Halalkalibacterium halodurans]MED4104039.1 TetR/AcrR family transcriptional regulator [Halalkalibacteri
MAKPNVVTKEQLIEAAKRCIVEKGIHSLTLKSVAEGAGVTQGTVYYHFRSKDQLMLEIVESMCTSAWHSLESMSKQEGENTHWIQAALHSAHDRTTKDAYFHKLLASLIVTGFTNEQIRQKLEKLFQFENQVLKEQMAAVLGDHELHGVSLEVWSVLFNALIDGLAIQALVAENTDIDGLYHHLHLLVNKLLEASRA